MHNWSQSDEMSCASAPYIYFKFHEIRFRGCLVMTNCMDFKLIQGLYLMNY